MRQIKIRNNRGRASIQFTVNGSQYSLTRGEFNNPADYRAMEITAYEISLAIEKGEFNGLDKWQKVQRGSLSLKNLIQELKADIDRQHFSSILKHLENYQGRLSNTAQVQKWMNSIECKTSTKRRYLTALKIAFPEWKEEFNISLRAKKGEKEKIDPFTEIEVKRIIEYFQGKKYQPFIVFLFHTGCRTSEAIGIQWKNIDFENNRVYIDSSLSKINNKTNRRIRKETKTGVKRYTPMSDALIEELRELQLIIEINQEDYSGNSDDLIFYPQISEENLKYHWKKGIAALGIRYRKLYNTRHTFISHALQKGVSVVQIAKLVGNSPEIIYKHYAGLIDECKLPKLY